MSQQSELLKSLFGLSMIVEARDPYTGGHLWRVSQFSRLLSEVSGLTPRATALAELGGFLHDLGKVGVPDSILKRPGKLEDAEFDVIRTHPAIGQRLLTPHPLSHLAIEAVAGHHEMPNGNGYPRGLRGDAIPAVARIVAIADAFDAMTSTRPYRPGMPIANAMAIITERIGTQFDADLGRRFAGLASGTQLEHIVAHSEPGIPLLACSGCSAPMVVTRSHRVGDCVVCRHCGAQAKLVKTDGNYIVERLDERADAFALSPAADTELIGAMVEATAPLVL
ncbi:Phosphohydrolase [Georgfuchsia toluolica]|uniref:Phosphohydrolase n=1 Tax=Georgfuchsia toluolica TaxID=424218 RepID=A0A916J224_9PROT|nr:HD domain-containing phosphohydrolase [Georgfuchsia toluolica]CAG4882391.1 Phosphohydrolase [Georgfuchsia toluolica]